MQATSLSRLERGKGRWGGRGEQRGGERGKRGLSRKWEWRGGGEGERKREVSIKRGKKRWRERLREGSKRGRVRIQQDVGSSLWSLHIISTLQGTSRINCALY